MRLPALILGAAPAGLAAGVLAWMAAGGAGASSGPLDAAARQLAALRKPRPSAVDLSVPEVAGLAATPLFTLTTGPGAVPEPVVQVAGLSRSRGRAAALLSINDKPAEWLTRGDSREGVTLQAVLGASVVVDTIYGQREVALGERSASAAPAGAPPAAAVAAISDAPPPGVRLPPPPASAPKPR